MPARGGGRRDVCAGACGHDATAWEAFFISMCVAYDIGIFMEFFIITAVSLPIGSIQLDYYRFLYIRVDSLRIKPAPQADNR